MKFGLSEEIYIKIKNVLKNFSQYKFKIFGSRARGDYKNNSDIDSIIIVADSVWHYKICNWIKEYKISKFISFALPGSTRQESLINGLKVCANLSKNFSDGVIIHDAVRPLVRSSLISECLNKLKEADGCMPILPVNDTIYLSNDGKSITSLLDRNLLYAGQSPEAFNLCKYLKINLELSKEEIFSVKGSSEIAFRKNLNIALISGDEVNFKLTTPVDLKRFETIIKEENK